MFCLNLPLKWACLCVGMYVWVWVLLYVYFLSFINLTRIYVNTPFECRHFL